MRFLTLHLGLGDAVICAGLVNFLSQKEKIMIPCYKHNHENIKQFFHGNENIEIRVVSGDAEVESYASSMPSIRMGCFVHDRTENKGHLHFAELFYSDAGVDYRERYNSCPLGYSSRDIRQVNSEADVFVSITGSSGEYMIREEFLKDKIVISPVMKFPLLAYAEIIKKAKEIHCIESSFLQLCDQLPTNGRLFYHKYARPGSNAMNFNKDWKIIE